jgi:DNA-binding NarL/FixJ family response regulator
MFTNGANTINRATPPVRISGRGMVGVMLVDQIPMFRDGMYALVSHSPGLQWTGSTPSVQTAVVMSERIRPDIVIIDSVLDPRGHLTRLLTSRNSKLTVVVLVRDPFRTERYISELLEAGAHGLILRSAEPTQLIEALRRAHRERHYIDPALSVLIKRGTTAYAPGARQPLSGREYEVLQLIADGLDNQGIGKRLYVSVETVRTHVKSILRKLHARDRAHAVSIAFRLGVLVACDSGPDIPVPERPASVTHLQAQPA